MKAVLDEGVPKRLARALRERGWDVSPFPARWKGLRNGFLLARLSSESFDCLPTCDKNFSFQQSIGRFQVCLIVLPAQRIPDLFPVFDEIDRALGAFRPGRTILVASRRNA